MQLAKFELVKNQLKLSVKKGPNYTQISISKKETKKNLFT